MSTLYDLDLRAVGVKDRELTRRIDEVKRLRAKHAEYFAAADAAHRAKATLPERLRDEAAASLSAGDEPKDPAQVITETEQAAAIADARVDGAAKALREAEQAVEAHLSEVAAAHRDAARERIAEHRTAATEAVEAATAEVDALLHGLSALMQFQPMPTRTVGGVGATSGLSGLPSHTRRNIGVEYAQHAARALLRDLRAEVEALLPPSEEMFTAAAEDKRGYLHRLPDDRDRFAGIVTSKVPAGQQATGGLLW